MPAMISMRVVVMAVVVMVRDSAKVDMAVIGGWFIHGVNREGWNEIYTTWWSRAFGSTSGVGWGGGAWGGRTGGLKRIS